MSNHLNTYAVAIKNRKSSTVAATAIVQATDRKAALRTMVATEFPKGFSLRPEQHDWKITEITIKR